MAESREKYPELCGEPMPAGEEMFKFHGYSGDCPKPPKPDAKLASVQAFEKWWPSHSYHTFRLTKDDALKVWIASRENL